MSDRQGNKKPQYALRAGVRVFSGGQSWEYQEATYRSLRSGAINPLRNKKNN